MKIYKYNLLIKLLILFIIMTILIFFIRFYFKPFWTLFIIFVLATPTYNILLKAGINKKVSAVISIIFCNVMIFLILTIISKTFYNLLSSFSGEFNNVYNSFLLQYKYIFDYIKDIQFIDVLNIVGKGNIGLKIKNTGNQFIAYFIGNIACYFIFTEKEQICFIMNKILSIDIVNQIRNQKNNMLEMILIEGKLIILSTIAIIIGFYFLGVNNYLFLGLICGILDILPYIGTVIVFIPLIVYNFFVKRYFFSIGLILLYVFVQLIREILEAKFLGKNLKVHPIVIFLFMYIFIEMFGFVGVIFGPIYCILAKDMILKDN